MHLGKLSAHAKGQALVIKELVKEGILLCTCARPRIIFPVGTCSKLRHAA